MKFGSNLFLKSEKEAADDKATRGGAMAEGNPVPTQNHRQQPADRRISLGDVSRKMVKDAGLHLKINSTANCLRPSDLLKAPETMLRRTSADICLPQRLPSPSLPRRPPHPVPLPLPPQSGCKKRPPPGREGMMPPNLLNELNSVLSKTGRSGKKSD